MTTFKETGLSFLLELERMNGDDLVYSMAREKGQTFLMITAFPSMTKRRWNLSEEERRDEDGLRLMFLLDEDDLNMDQGELLNSMKDRIDHYTLQDEVNEA